MASITQFSTRREHTAGGWSRWLCVLALGLCAVAPRVEAFEVRNGATRLQNGIYQLNARIDYVFSAEVLEALNNGVPLTLHVEVEVQRIRHWWTNETIAQLEQRHQLTYHAFSDQYLLRNLNRDTLTIHPTLSQALAALGSIDDFPLLAADRIAADEEFQVLLRASLDIEALPAPLRPVAYVTPAWRLSSAWYTCSLTP